MKLIARFAAFAALCFAFAAGPAAAREVPNRIDNIVLVHGAWADGSGWRGVYDILTHKGYNVSIVQNPLSALADDVAAARRVIAMQNGPVILVGHSYGGAVISEAGNDPKVAGLVFIAALAPDAGESVQSLIPPDAPAPPVTPSADGYLFLNRDAFRDTFAGDVNARDAAFMAAAQQPFAAAAFSGVVATPAWRSKPSWYMVATEDHAIPPEAERRMAARAGSTVVEVRGSHALYASHAREVAALIERAATDPRIAAGN